MVTRERQGALSRGEPGIALYRVNNSPDSARAEDNAIVNEPGQCSTPVRENQRREPEGI